MKPWKQLKLTMASKANPVEDMIRQDALFLAAQLCSNNNLGMTARGVAQFALDIAVALRTLPVDIK